MSKGLDRFKAGKVYLTSLARVKCLKTWHQGTKGLFVVEETTQEGRSVGVRRMDSWTMYLPRENAGVTVASDVPFLLAKLEAAQSELGIKTAKAVRKKR